MKSIEKIQSLVLDNSTENIERNRDRIKNRPMLKESRNIALKVLEKLEELSWSQKKLAEAMNVSPQQVSKIVSGKENLTIETQVKLQDVLNIPILASYYERIFNELIELFTCESSIELEIKNPVNYLTNFDFNLTTETEKKVTLKPNQSNEFVYLRPTG